MPTDIAVIVPGRASDAGPDTKDRSDERDCCDWIYEVTEEIHTASRAGKGAARYEAIRRAQFALNNAAELAEKEILCQWLSYGLNEVIPERVAPSVEWQKDLARDMRALGWRMINGRYLRPEPPMWRQP